MSKKRVLVINENDSELDDLISGLSWAGFSVTCAPSHFCTLLGLKIISADIIFIKYQSDESLEICRLLHKEYCLPVILIGNEKDEDLWHKALVIAEADFYVQRPFDLDELVLRMKAIIWRYNKEHNTKTRNIIPKHGL